MPWFKWRRRKSPQKIYARSFRFLGEQDGPPERILKAKLIEFFKRDQSVRAAYLARTDFGEGSAAGVALCLRTQFGADKGMVDKIGAIFATVFNARMHLDIVFLIDDQEEALKRLCQPFFGETKSPGSEPC